MLKLSSLTFWSIFRSGEAKNPLIILCETQSFALELWVLGSVSALLSQWQLTILIPIGFNWDRISPFSFIIPLGNLWAGEAGKHGFNASERNLGWCVGLSTGWKPGLLKMGCEGRARGQVTSDGALCWRLSQGHGLRKTGQPKVAGACSEHEVFDGGGKKIRGYQTQSGRDPIMV